MTMQPLKASMATSSRKNSPRRAPASKPTRARREARSELPTGGFGALRRLTTIVDTLDDLLSAGDGWSVE
jgi:hypothetical protein